LAAGFGTCFVGTVSSALGGRRMRRLILTISAAAVLVFTASALAVVPSHRSVFKGVTSEHRVNGYKPTIQFVAQPGGKLTNFVFETLGCFGSGTFPVGVDPFAEAPWKLPRITVPKTGVVNAKVNATTNALDAGKMSVTVTGTFTSASKMTGKLTFSQDQSGATCGPKTVKFAVSTNAPSTLDP
jgi:hypothetical protein